MAGHSQFKNIMHRKGAQDAKRAKAFTKVTREITVAVKEGGPDPESNARLRAAMLAARAVNMPKDNVERTIKKAQGDDNDVLYVPVRYEGYGPDGVAIIVEALTDNRNRTAADVRSTFNKFNGNLGEPNSVSFQFNHIGMIIYPSSVADSNTVFEVAAESGADDVESNENVHIIRCRLEDLNKIREHMQQKFGDPQSAQIVWDAINTVPVTAAHAPTLLKLLDVLEDNDDVQQVFANCAHDDIMMQALEAQLL